MAQIKRESTEKRGKRKSGTTEKKRKKENGHLAQSYSNRQVAASWNL